jgi:hypothetical protein
MVLVLTLIVSTFPNTIFAAQAKIQGDYCYQYGDSESLMVAKEISYAMALRKAIETYKTFVASTSVVQDFKLRKDLVETIASGYVEKIEILRQDIEGRTVCTELIGYVDSEIVERVIKKAVAEKEGLDKDGWYKLILNKFHPADNSIGYCSGDGYVCTSQVSEEQKKIESTLGFKVELPEVKEVYGRAKFVDLSGDGSGFNLGYYITVDMNSFDMRNIPKKYREYFKYFTYRVDFEFRLRDANRFRLMFVEGKYFLYPSSGKKSVFQSIIREAIIPKHIANQTRYIDFHMTISSCSACDRLLRKVIAGYKPKRLHLAPAPIDEN